jgi:hypothetical protein
VDEIQLENLYSGGSSDDGFAEETKSAEPLRSSKSNTPKEGLKAGAMNTVVASSSAASAKEVNEVSSQHFGYGDLSRVKAFESCCRSQLH